MEERVSSHRPDIAAQLELERQMASGLPAGPERDAALRQVSWRWGCSDDDIEAQDRDTHRALTHQQPE